MTVTSMVVPASLVQGERRDPLAQLRSSVVLVWKRPVSTETSVKVLSRGILPAQRKSSAALEVNPMAHLIAARRLDMGRCRGRRLPAPVPPRKDRLVAAAGGWGRGRSSLAPLLRWPPRSAHGHQRPRALPGVMTITCRALARRGPGEGRRRIDSVLILIIAIRAERAAVELERNLRVLQISLRLGKLLEAILRSISLSIPLSDPPNVPTGEMRVIVVVAPNGANRL